MLESVCRPYCASAALGTRTNTIVPRIFVFIAAIAFFSLGTVHKLTPFRAGRCDRDHTPARQASFARQAASLPSSGRAVGYGDLRPTAPRGVGGREWESNPPETGSLPHTDLKSERPTGDDSPPFSAPD